MEKRINKFIFWAPRGLSIIFILFLALLSLDIFDGNYGFWGTIVGLFMHNIPTFILIAVLVISWKREIIGAVSYIVAGLIYLMIWAASSFRNGFNLDFIFGSLPIAGPAFLIGILYLVGWSRKKG